MKVDVTQPENFNYLTANEFFDLPTCSKLIAEIRESPPWPAEIYGQQTRGTVNEAVRRVSQRVLPEATVTWVTQRLLEFRERAAAHFTLELDHMEPPQFLCYRPGDFFVPHQDGNTGLIALDSDRTRRISVSIFLNNQTGAAEADSYAGGSLIFHDWRRELKYEFAANAGTLVAFPSETTHEITPVSGGERFAVVTWFGVGRLTNSDP